MMKNVQLGVINRPSSFVELNVETGVFSALVGDGYVARGNYIAVEDQDVAVFAADRQLYLQWNKRRWNFADLGHNVKYEHDFHRGVTTFSIDGDAIQYPAWWVGDETFDPNLPELDEDEDHFAYIASLAKNKELQRSLIDVWSR
ncbi:hypothetical protein [Burkholderia anthina]|uniref:hypothetical protein n=1 Tax=Burkholderia anthina TaxID=179879 RepID=UPI00158BC41F